VYKGGSQHHRTAKDGAGGRRIGGHNVCARLDPRNLVSVSRTRRNGGAGRWSVAGGTESSVNRSLLRMGRPGLDGRILHDPSFTRLIRPGWSRRARTQRGLGPTYAWCYHFPSEAQRRDADWSGPPKRMNRSGRKGLQAGVDLRQIGAPDWPSAAGGRAGQARSKDPGVFSSGGGEKRGASSGAKPATPTLQTVPTPDNATAGARLPGEPAPLLVLPAAGHRR